MQTSESRWCCGVPGIGMQYAFTHRPRDIYVFVVHVNNFHFVAVLGVRAYLLKKNKGNTPRHQNLVT